MFVKDTHSLSNKANNIEKTIRNMTQSYGKQVSFMLASTSLFQPLHLSIRPTKGIFSLLKQVNFKSRLREVCVNFPREIRY